LNFSVSKAGNFDSTMQKTKNHSASINQPNHSADTLPPGWKKVKLGDISKSIQYGYTESSTMTKVGPKFLRITDIQNSKVNWDEVPYCKIEEKVKEKYLLKKGDLVFARTGATVGKSFLLNSEIPESVFASYLIRVRVSNEADINYISYFFNSGTYWKQITEGQVGIGQPNVNGTKLSQLEIPLPSLPTQHLIVTKLEELFSELDKGIEQLKTAQQQLKVYRQAVLKWAFEGKLSQNRRLEGLNDFADDKNVKREISEIPKSNESAVQTVELPQGWKWVKMKDITILVTDGDHQPPPKSSEGIPFITISNVIKGLNRIDFSKTFKVGKEYYSNLHANRKPIMGDILYTVTGSFGIPILVDFEKEFCFQRHIGLIRPMNNVNQKWLYYLLQSPVIYDQAKLTATGTAQKTVALKSLRNFNIPYCDSSEQENIVQQIETRLSVADKLEETIAGSLQQAEALRQSILKRAFEGKLVNERQERVGAKAYALTDEPELSVAAEPAVKRKAVKNKSKKATGSR
jgi:type I restriction enzyme, S subunit